MRLGRESEAIWDATQLFFYTRAPSRPTVPVSYRDIAVDNKQLLSGHVKLAAQLIRLPVDDPEAFVVRVENGLEKLQLGLQSRNRHLALISV